MSETALGVRLQLHSELQGEGFTSHPLLAENNLIFDCGSCVCVCVCVCVRACAEAEEGSVVRRRCALWNCSPLPCAFSKSLESGTLLFPSLPP